MREKAQIEYYLRKLDETLMKIYEKDKIEATNIFFLIIAKYISAVRPEYRQEFLGKILDFIDDMELMKNESLEKFYKRAEV